MMFGLSLSITQSRALGEAAPPSMPLFSNAAWSSILAGGSNPRSIRATALVSGTPTQTDQTVFRDCTPVQVATTATFHMPEFRDIATTSGNRYVLAIHAKQGTAPTLRIKIRDAVLASETLVTFTWSGATFARNNANVWGTATYRTSAGPDGTTLIEIEADASTTTADLRVGAGPDNAASQTVILYTMAVAQV